MLFALLLTFEILGLGLVISGDITFCLFRILVYSVEFSVSYLLTNGLLAIGLNVDKPFLFVFVMKALSFVVGMLMVVVS